jgi:hypothetical protein
MKSLLVILVILSAVFLGLRRLSLGSASHVHFNLFSVSAAPQSAVHAMGANPRLGTPAKDSGDSMSPGADGQNGLGDSVAAERAKTLHMIWTYGGLILLIPLVYQWIRSRNLAKGKHAPAWRGLH